MATSRPLHAVNLSYLSFGLIQALDARRGEGLELDETMQRIRNGKALLYLSELDETDISLLPEGIWWEIEGRWRSLLSAYSPAEFGVQSNGLCLMLALTVELLQEGFDPHDLGDWQLSRLVESIDVGKY